VAGHAARRGRLAEQADAAPTTLCHYDAFRGNMAAAGEETVLLDWEYVGLGALGQDPGHLAVESLFMGQVAGGEAGGLAAAVFAGYLAGLADAGWRGDARAVRRAYCASASRRWLNTAVRRTVQAATCDDPALRARFERWMGMPIERCARQLTLRSCCSASRRRRALGDLPRGRVRLLTRSGVDPAPVWRGFRDEASAATRVDPRPAHQSCWRLAGLRDAPGGASAVLLAQTADARVVGVREGAVVGFRETGDDHDRWAVEARCLPFEDAEVAAIVDGTYAAEGALDDDGADHGPVLIVLGDLESADSEAKELLGVGGHR
jgi:hypothetical protein